jgi:sugar lactone lactonase YvrE
MSSGDISNKRVIIKIETTDGYPDGMTIDNEGMLWIAHWDGWQASGWNPVTGEKIDVVKMPVEKLLPAHSVVSILNIYISPRQRLDLRR